MSESTRRVKLEWLRARPLVLFFVLTYLLSWWPATLYVADLSATPIIGVGPFLAALIVLSLTRGKAGVKDLLRRIVTWRVHIRWYLVALFLPVLAAIVATTLNIALGAERPTSAMLAEWPSILVIFVLFLLIPGIAGTWEEPGFRGYALPTLQKRRSPLIASLIIGVLWVVWHVPLFLTGQIRYPDILSIMAASVVLAWVYNSSGGSVLMVMLMHTMNNAINGEFFSPMFTGADSLRQAMLVAGVWAIVAVVAIATAGASLGLTRDTPRTTPVPDPVSVT
jgi:uncharacterized protein